MKWTKFSEHFPAHSSGGILVYDGRQIFIGYVDQDLGHGDSIKTYRKYCNVPTCRWRYDNDDCNCKILLTKDSWWMGLPKKPQISGWRDDDDE